MRNSTDIINKLKEILKLKSDGELAKHLNISSGAIPNWKSRNKIPYEEVFTICEELNINPNNVFYDNYKEDNNKIKENKVNFKEEISNMLDELDDKKAEIYYHLIKAELLKEKL